MLADLVAQQDHHVWIAWQEDNGQLQHIVFGNGTDDVFKVPPDVTNALRKQQREPYRPPIYMGDPDVRRSPDGKWIVYRKAENQFLLVDPDGVVRREITAQTEIETPMSWSPDSQYLLYCLVSQWWDMHPIRDIEGKIT
jgi:hypothetical protein